MYIFLRFYFVALFLLPLFSVQAQKAALQDYDQYQDSLRCVLKQLKNNRAFSNPFLEELYLRDLFSMKKDSVKFMIPFDSHSNDCGAPDCYVTQVEFVLAYSDSILLPDSLKITYRDVGCYNQFTIPSTSYFYLINRGVDILVYYNWYYRASLVFFTEQGKKKSSSYSFFIENVDISELSVKKIYDMRDNYEIDDEHNIYPYTSTKLSRGYECFIAENVNN